MAEDFVALTTALENDARYDAAVRAGANSTITTLLDIIDASAAFVFEDIPIADLLEAAGQVRLKALIPPERARLQIILGQHSLDVTTSRTVIRTELLDILQLTEAQLVAGVPAVRRRPVFGEAFGYKTVSLNTVREAVRLIAKSFIVSTGQV